LVSLHYRILQSRHWRTAMAPVVVVVVVVAEAVTTVAPALSTVVTTATPEAAMAEMM
jgi:hypothetical protein